jgi:hypothetical protein
MSDRQSVHVRLPASLIEDLKARAYAEGVSINTLIATLLAGAVGFDLAGRASDPTISRKAGSGRVTSR